MPFLSLNVWYYQCLAQDFQLELILWEFYGGSQAVLQNFAAERRHLLNRFQRLPSYTAFLRVIILKN